MNAEEVLLMKMADIVFVEKRPFCYLDFLFFEHEGQSYKFTHGTIRNIFSKLRKRGDIVFDFRSGPSFYSLHGNKFGNPMTDAHRAPSHLLPKQRNFLDFLQKILMDKPAIHDIRLSFSFKPLWSILSVSSSPLIKKIDTDSNKDITLEDINLYNLVIKTTVHKTNTVSVIVACTLNPVPVDLYGLTRLTSSLARVEERLQLLVNDYSKASVQGEENKQEYASLNLNNKIPDHMSWIVKMWHFGQDALTSYSGEKFDLSVEDALNVLHHAYSKKYRKKMKIRKEVQEYPNKSLEDVFMDKLDDNKVIARI
ncbi:MAG: hypothetical protein ACTHKK_03545 [Candidatus Nitrosocosmicus sp.]